MYHLKKTIVLVGMMGAGKTAVGKAVAARLDVPFLDSDDEIVKAASMSIDEIFKRDGEAFFRARETEVIARLMDGEIGVLSTGGGAFLSPENRALIHRLGASICLAANLDLLWARVRHKSTRPLLQTTNPYETLKEIYTLRAPIYAQADLTIQANPKFSIEEMATAVIETLQSRPDVLEKK